MIFRRKKRAKDRDRTRMVGWVPTEENGPAIWKCPENRFPEGLELYVGPGQEAYIVRDGKILNFFIMLQNILTLADHPYLAETVDGDLDGRPVFSFDIYYTDSYRVFSYPFDTGPLDTGTDSPARPRCRGSLTLRITYARDLMALLVPFTPEIGEESIRAFLDRDILPLIRQVMAGLLRMDGPVPQAFGRNLPALSDRALQALNPLLRPYGIQAEKLAIDHVQWTQAGMP